MRHCYSALSGGVAFEEARLSFSITTKRDRPTQLKNIEILACRANVVESKRSSQK